MVFPAVPSCNLSAMVTELKLDNATIYPVVEHLSAVAASITMDALKSGYLVNEISIFGVVVPVNSFDHSHLIKLKWEFKTGQCHFLPSSASTNYYIRKCTNFTFVTVKNV